MKPKILWTLLVSGSFALLGGLGCEDYESPGPVAGEGLWSHVPADSMEENVSPHRLREREVGQVEDKVSGIRLRLARIEEQLDDAEGPRPAEERELEELRARLEPMDRRIAQLRSLVDQPAAFRGVRDDLRDSLNELSADVAALADRVGPR